MSAMLDSLLDPQRLADVRAAEPLPPTLPTPEVHELDVETIVVAEPLPRHFEDSLPHPLTRGMHPTMAACMTPFLRGLSDAQLERRAEIREQERDDAAWELAGDDGSDE